MKKILFILTAAVAVLLGACEDDPKPAKVEWSDPVYAQGEYEALMTIYDALHLDKSDYYNGLRNFWGSKINKRWNGVTFEADAETGELYVTKLTLKELPYNADAVLPDVFDKFSRLRGLYINGGYDLYSKEDGWRTLSLLKIPESICRCPLDSLSINYPIGELPANFSELSKTLEYVNISNSEFDNRLLTILQGFPKLKKAYLGYNKFTGKVPNFGECIVSFAHNNFTEFNWDYLANKKSLNLLPYLGGNRNLKGPFIMTVEELLQKDYTAAQLDSVFYLKFESDHPFRDAWATFYGKNRERLNRGY